MVNVFPVDDRFNADDQMVGPPAHMEWREFLQAQFPPPADILPKILQERGALMIHGPTGVGKTQIAAGLAVACASAGKFLNYSVSEPKSVVFCDFECQAATIQKRIASAIQAIGKGPQADFRVVTPDLSYPAPMPDLSTYAGREALEQVIAGFNVVFIDNISTSFRSLSENDAEGWQIMNDWILKLRASGQSIVLIQHEGKSSGNGYRGHSKQGDVVDSIVQLKRVEDEEGVLRVDICTKKCRHHELPPPVGARMEVREGKTHWEVIDLDFSNKDKAEQLFQLGMSAKEVANELGVSLGHAYKLKKAVE